MTEEPSAARLAETAEGILGVAPTAPPMAPLPSRPFPMLPPAALPSVAATSLPWGPVGSSSMPSPVGLPSTLQDFLPKPGLAGKIAPLAIFAAALALGKRGNGLAQGYSAAQQNIDAMNLHRAQLLQQDALRQQQQARLDAEEQRRLEQAQLARRQGLGKLVFDTRVQGRTYKTREQFNDYLKAADEQATQIYGAAPGYVSNQVTFIPPAIQDRAREQVETLRKGWKSLGLTPDQMQQSERDASVAFDVDGDGKAETVPIAQLLDWSGERMLDAKGNPIVPAKSRVQTFGEVFAVTKGTPFADKPLPTKAGAQGERQPDYGEASLTLERMGLLTSKTDRQRAIEDTRKSLRDDLEASMTGGAPIADPTAFARQMSKVGLNFQVEQGRIRSDLIKQGLSLLPPTERDRYLGSPDTYNPAALIERAKAARSGATPPAPPAAPGLTTTMTRTELKAVAKRLGISEQAAEQQANARGLRIVGQ